LRLNCNATYIFPSSQSEVEILKDEVCPAGLTKKQFEKVIEYATSEPYSFLSINNHTKPKERFRRNLDEIIDLEKYKN
jgi:coproporphyrinogen III oxidase-like Fe-S oxidoreductase